MSTVAAQPRKNRKPDEPHQVIVRMAHRVWQELEQDADANFRTINSHILWLIEERLKRVRSEEAGNP